MVRSIGLYNVEFLGFVYSKIPDIETEKDVQAIMKFPSGSKIKIQRAYKVEKIS